MGTLYCPLRAIIVVNEDRKIVKITLENSGRDGSRENGGEKTETFCETHTANLEILLLCRGYTTARD